MSRAHHEFQWKAYFKQVYFKRSVPVFSKGSDTEKGRKKKIFLFYNGRFFSLSRLLRSSEEIAWRLNRSCGDHRRISRLFYLCRKRVLESLSIVVQVLISTETSRTTVIRTRDLYPYGTICWMVFLFLSCWTLSSLIIYLMIVATLLCC